MAAGLLRAHSPSADKAINKVKVAKSTPSSHHANTANDPNRFSLHAPLSHNQVNSNPAPLDRSSRIPLSPSTAATSKANSNTAKESLSPNRARKRTTLEVTVAAMLLNRSAISRFPSCQSTNPAPKKRQFSRAK